MSGKDTARRLSELAQGSSALGEGICEGDHDWVNRLVMVNLEGVPIAMPWAGGNAPWKGDRVRVFFLGNQPVCTPVYGASQGTVVTIADNYATVLGDDNTTYKYPVPRGVELSNGHRVRLDHEGRGIAYGYMAEPEGSEYIPPPPPPVPPVNSGRAEFRPNNSGSWSGGAFRAQSVEVNVNRLGLYYYGSQIVSTIPNSATITRAELHLVETFNNVSGVPARLGAHDQGEPSTQPVIGGVIDINGSGVYDLRAGGIADALKLGTQLGVGFELGIGWRGFESHVSSGLIYMEWSG